MPESFLPAGATERRIDVGGVELHCVEAGSGPLVVLLHGFPEFWYSWRHQIPALVHAGYRVVAPDMRGYNLSDRPARVRAYSGERLAGDVKGLIEALGERRAHVVGHDWGAVVAYYVATWHPGTVDHLAILNVPHPRRMLEGMRSFKQLRKSWYIFFFQIPGLAERLLPRDDYSFLKRALRSGSEGAFSDADLERYVEAWSRPGALRAGINYYRAAFRQNPKGALGRLRPIAAPTLVIWGTGDVALGRELADPGPELVPDRRVEYLEGITHWTQVHAPERVNELLTEFLPEPEGTRKPAPSVQS